MGEGRANASHARAAGWWFLGIGALVFLSIVILPILGVRPAIFTTVVLGSILFGVGFWFRQRAAAIAQFAADLHADDDSSG
jgi:hypothetical protein